ncbi:P2Y purinoceptor 11 [Erinaceus europaeus]|uniref:P2Y purinoceptor 11 n=1 Tax=Erinaceus europaeus TaxID=9365 RepID=A0ABM3WM89_ERIEU|nr:P2Y purinoceptor 11 [Erinaceus europaeus]
MATTDAPSWSCPSNVSLLVDRILGDLQRPLWPLLLLEFGVSAGGNGVALWRLWRWGARPWAPPAVLSAQLALSHLLLALTLPPQAAYLAPPKHWRHGAIACRLERFLAAANVLGGAVFTAAIGLTRYLGVAHPFFTRGRLRPRHAWAASAGGWALSALLAAPTLHFSRLQDSRCSGPGFFENHTCIKCLDSAGDHHLEAFQAYRLALAVLGCGVPLLITVASWGGLVRALVRSPGLARAEKLRVGALVAAGGALFAGSYVPYHALLLLNLGARRAWLHRCRGFEDEAQVVRLLDRGTYAGYQVSRVLLPLAGCLHPLLYLAAVPGLCGGASQPPAAPAPDRLLWKQGSVSEAPPPGPLLWKQGGADTRGPQHLRGT